MMPSRPTLGPKITIFSLIAALSFVCSYEAISQDIVYAGDFTEAAANDGSVTGSRTATIMAIDTYVAGPFVENTHYTLSGIPANLTGALARTSGTVATLTIANNALAHEMANDATITITLLDAAFTSGAAPIDGSDTDAAGMISFDDAPSIMYLGDFTEDQSDNGALIGSRVATISGGTTFTSDGSSLVFNTDYTLPNMPAGLTPDMAITGGGVTATLTFTSTATANASANDVAAFEINFLDGAINVVAVADIPTSNDTNGTINFLDGTIGYVGNFTENVSNDGSVMGTRVATISGSETFVATMTLTNEFDIPNLPGGMGATMVVAGSDATLSLTGMATMHANGNDENNLQIVFNNSAFTGGDAALVGNSTDNNGVVVFFSNTPPTENANTGTSIAEGGTEDVIRVAELDFDDAEQGDRFITYTITTDVTNGTLYNDVNGNGLSGGEEITTGGTATFTQQDIVDREIKYDHDDSETISDGFNFDVSDGGGGNVTAQSFAITVTVVHDQDPVFENVGPFNVDENSIATTGVGNVDANDGEGAGTAGTDANITYSITSSHNPDGDGNEAFTIDMNSGAIAVNDPGDLDEETTMQFNLTIEADDGVNTAQSQVYDVDINDVVPTRTTSSIDVLDNDGLNINVTLEDDATVYYSIRETNSPPADNLEIFNGNGTDGIGNFPYTTPDVSGFFTINRLDPGVDYYVFWYAEDGSTNQISFFSEPMVTTAVDMTPPAFITSSGHPSVNTTYASGFLIETEFDELGDVYYVVIPNDDPAPSALQVKNGTDGSDNPSVRSGNFNITQLTTLTDTELINFLTANTAYDIYLVAEDVAANLTADIDVEKIDATTSSEGSGVSVAWTSSDTDPLVLCLGDGFVDIGTITIREPGSDKAAFANNGGPIINTLILTIPNNFEFNTLATVTWSDDGSDDFDPNPTVAVTSATTITVSYDVDATDERDEMILSGIEIRALSTGDGDLLRLPTVALGGDGDIDGNQPGDGRIHASFTVGNIASDPTSATFTYCQEDGLNVNVLDFASVPVGTKNDADFEWYSDPGLAPANWVHSGGLVTDLNSDLGVSTAAPGTFTFYVINSGGGGACPSNTAIVEFVVNAIPVADAGTNFSVCNGEQITVGGFPSLSQASGLGPYTYTWSGPQAIPQVSNPMFTPADNNTGGDRVDGFTLVITDDATTCMSSASMIDVTVHDGINPTLFYSPDGGVNSTNTAIPGSAPLDLIVAPVAIAPPTSQSVFTGSGIAYNSGTSFYQFSPSLVIEDPVNPYITTYTYTDPVSMCEESISDNILVADKSVFDPVIIDNCEEDPSYPILLSAQLKADMITDGQTFISLQYANGGLLPRVDLGAPGNDTDDEFTIDPVQVRINGSVAFGVNNVNVITSPIGIYVKQDLNIFQNPVTAININALYCTDDTPFQLSAEVGGSGVVAGNGTYRISNVGVSGPFSNPTGLDMDGNINFSQLGVGFWWIEYTSDPADNSNGCSGTDVFAFEIITPAVQPIVSLKSYQPQPATLPNLNELLGDYTWVYCEGDIIQDFFLDFTDVGEDKIQDLLNNTKKLFRWYDDPSLNAIDQLVVTVGFGDEDGRLVDRFDLFPAAGGSPIPGTYDFYVTTTNRRNGFPAGDIFEGCESVATQITITIVADPVEHDIDDAMSPGFEPVVGIETIEYCDTDMVADIDLNLTIPSVIGGDEIVWLDAGLNEIFTTNSTTVSPIQLGLGTAIPNVFNTGSRTPGANQIIAPTTEIDRTSFGGQIFQGGETITAGTVGFLAYSLTPGPNFVVGETITSQATGATGDVTQIFVGSLTFNNINGIFPNGDVIDGSNGGQAIINIFQPVFSMKETQAQVVSDDGITLVVQNIIPSTGSLTAGQFLWGNSSQTQGILISATQNVTTLPYTYFYQRRDDSALIPGFPGCDGPITQVDIWVYPTPVAPVATGIFDTFIYACVGDILGTDDVITPVGDNPDILYNWYQNPTGGSAFASDDIGYDHLPAFDEGVSGISTYYLSQVTNSKDASTPASLTGTFTGCESTGPSGRTAVRIEVFDIPAKPDVLGEDNLGAELSTITTVAAIQHQFFVCVGEITSAYTFEANPIETIQTGEEYNWYTSPTGRGFNIVNDFIGTFTKTATAGNLSIGSAAIPVDFTIFGSKFFAVIKKENIIDGEFNGCESPATIFEVVVQSILGTPTFADAFFPVCQTNVLGSVDPGLGGGTYNWYANQADVGGAPLFTGPIANAEADLLLNTSVDDGSFFYYVTEVTNANGSSTPSFPGCETAALDALEIEIEVTALPVVTISQGRLGFPTNSEFCIDDVDLTLNGSPLKVSPEDGKFTSVNPDYGNIGISDNDDGTATFNFQAAYDEVEFENDVVNRQAAYDVLYTFTDASGCLRTNTIPIVINNIPEASYEIRRGKTGPILGTSGTAGQVIQVCEGDVSISGADINTERITLLNLTNATTFGPFFDATIKGRIITAGLNIDITSNASVLENVLGADLDSDGNPDNTGEAYFYPTAAIGAANVNPILQLANPIVFEFDLDYKNNKACVGDVEIPVNKVVIEVFKTPRPEMGVTIAESANNEIQVCIDHLDIGEPVIEFSNDGVLYDIGGNYSLIGSTFTYNGFVIDPMAVGADVALLAAVLNQTGDMAVFEPALAYAAAVTAGYADGSNPALFDVSYTFTSATLAPEPVGCSTESNVFRVTVHPLPSVEYDVGQLIDPLVPVDPLVPGLGRADGQPQFLDPASIQALVDAETIFFPLDEEEIVSGTFLTRELCEDGPPIDLNGRGFFGVDAGISEPGTGTYTSSQGNFGITNQGLNATFDPGTAFDLSGGQTDHLVKFTFTNTTTGCVNRLEKLFIINEKPVITLDEVGGCNGEAVTFNLTLVSLAPNDAINFIYWDFDDGTDDDRINNNLSEEFTYTGEGERTVTVQVFTNKGCTSLELRSDFFIGDIPNTNFIYEGLCADQPFEFQALPKAVNIGVVETFIMDFADGSPTVTVNRDDFIDPGTGLPPDEIPAEEFLLDHTFALPGIYPVALTVITTSGCTSTHSRLVPVLPTIVVTPDNPYVETFEGVADIIEVNIAGLGEEPVLDKLFVDGWVPDIRLLDDRDEFAGGVVDVDGNRSLNNTWDFGAINNPDPNGFITSGANGSTNAWVTNLDGPFADNESSWVFTPCFDISALDQPMVRFQRIFQFSDQRDGAVLQYSVDNGTTWEVLGDEAEPQGTGINWYEAQGLQGRPGNQEVGGSTNLVGWGGASQSATIVANGWSEARHKLDEIPFANGERQRVIFRFAIGAQSGDNQTEGSEGFGIDDFIIEERTKKVFVEHFSGSFADDASLAIDIEELRQTLEVDDFASGELINNDDAILITYKTDIVGADPINTQNPADNNARVVFYGVESLSTTVLNGIGGNATNTSTEQTGPFGEVVFNQSALPAPDVTVNVQLDAAADDQVAVTINMTNQNPAFDLNDENLRLYIAIVEKTVEDQGVLLRNVMRKFLPSGSGSPIVSDDNGVIESVSQSWNIQRVQDGDNLAVVAWIQNSNTKAVIQAASVDVGDKGDNIVTAIDDLVIVGENVNIYPNPANELVTVGFDYELDENFDWALFNQVGQLVKSGMVERGKQQFSIETDVFPSGMYYLRVGNEDRRFKHFKVVISH